MRRLIWLAGITAVYLLLATQGAFAVANNPCTAAEIARGKTTVCHVPPGNPENAMTICVGSTGANSPAAHLANHPGDSLGACGTPPVECDPAQVECCTDADCDDSNTCTDDTCNSSNTCDYTDNKTCCCQLGGDHCVQGCVDCTGQCIENATCKDSEPEPDGFVPSFCEGNT